MAINRFYRPQSSFARPVPRVLVSPSDAPNYSVCFRKEWLPYILGALQQLGQTTTWIADTDDEILQQLQLVNELYSVFIDGCSEQAVGDCVTLSPRSARIEWAPQNPFSEPDRVPDGYINPAWHLVDASDIASHVGIAEVGDVVSGWLSLPVTTPAIGSGLARFRVHVNGKARVDIHFMQIPNGGAVLCTKDDDILTAVEFELDRDLVSIPPETTEVIIAEFAFDTDGAHHIDCTFLPRFNDTEIFIGYGGGLRRVIVCGEDVTQMFDVRTKPSAHCILQKTIDGTSWLDTFDVTPCATEIAQSVAQQAIKDSGLQQPVTQPGGDTMGTGECVTFKAKLDARSRLLIPYPVASGWTVKISNVVGAWSDGRAGILSPWNCYNGEPYNFGHCGGLTATEGTDPAPSLPHMCTLLAMPDGTYHKLVDGVEFTIPSGMPSGSYVIAPNDGNLTDNAGDITFDVEVCNRVVTEFSVRAAGAYSGNCHGTGPYGGGTIDTEYTFHTTQETAYNPSYDWRIGLLFDHVVDVEVIGSMPPDLFAGWNVITGTPDQTYAQANPCVSGNGLPWRDETGVHLNGVSFVLFGTSSERDVTIKVTHIYS